MLEHLDRKQRAVAWVVGLWVSAACLWGFSNVEWGVSAVLLASIPAIVLGTLVIDTVRIKGQSNVSSTSAHRRPWVLALTVGAVSFAAGVLLSPFLNQGFRRIKAFSLGRPTVTASSLFGRRTLKQAFAEWQKQSSSDDFSRLSPEERLNRKEKFFREIFSQSAEYEDADVSGRELFREAFFWTQMQEAAVAKAKGLGGKSIALVSQEGWDTMEQWLASAFEKNGMAFEVKLHATRINGRVYNQLAVRYPQLIVLLGSSAMKDAVIEDIADGDRIYSSTLSAVIYSVEPPPGY